MKRKGFTLIELLAVIVILAIIALIAVPVVMNIITKANKSAFQDTAYGIIKAGELYYADQLLEPNGMETDEIFEFPNNIGNLQIKGNLPSKGNMIVSKEGKVAIAITNGKYCVRKDYDDNDITIDESLNDCLISSGPITYKNGIMSSQNKCIKTGTCENGTLVNVNVNSGDNYDFYVIKDTGTELTLIMDRNLGGLVAWVNQVDYEAVGGTDYGSTGRTEKGPLTALKALEDRTSGWTNIKEFTYTLNDDVINAYSGLSRNNVKARMLTYTEANALGCKYGEQNSCPSYLYSNTHNNSGGSGVYGYWLSSADSWQAARRVYTIGSIDVDRVAYSGINGVRPVIKISK